MRHKNPQRFAFLLLLYATTLFIFFVAVPANAATSQVIYQTDFSSDPGWTTDQPNNFHWDEVEGAYYAHTLNQPTYNSTSQPSRYAYTLTDLNPVISYELSYDIKILSVEGGNGAVPFGLYGERLYGFNQLNINFAGNNQDGTFSTRFVMIDGSLQLVTTEVNPGYNNDAGVDHQVGFGFGTWYTFHLRYDALTREYHFALTEKDSGMLVLEEIIPAPALSSVNPELRRLGISMHPEGLNATNLGYGDRINGSAEFLVDNVTLTQIYDETYTAPSSVYFLPGMQASRLYTDGLLGTEDQLWEPTRDQDVSELEMTEAGESVNDVYTRDVIRSAYGAVDVYDSFLNSLDTLKTAHTVSDVGVFAYDWRQAVDDIASQGTPYEDGAHDPVREVEDLARHNNSKVTLIAHSNGGLLAKALVRELEARGESYLIDRIIFVAVPHFGTPKAIGSVLHGYDQEKFHGLLVKAETARDVARNFPGTYGLVPSARYFEQSNADVVSFDTSPSTALFRNAYGDVISTVGTLKAFMAGSSDGRGAPSDTYEAGLSNEVMHTDALALHQLLDGWTAPAGIEVSEIVGEGLDTVKGFRYQEFTRRECTLGFLNCHDVQYYEAVPVLTQYGDATVVDQSAEGYVGSKGKYYLDLYEVGNDKNETPREHFDITELPSTQQLVASLLEKQNRQIPYVYSTKPQYTETRDLISVHSPVSITVTDTVGRVVEKIGDGVGTEWRTEIPGSAYIEFGESKYVVIPSGIDYTVALTGEAEGSYTLRIERLEGEADPVVLTTLAAATTTPDMTAEFTKEGGVFSTIKTDVDGDGVVDSVTTLDGEVSAHALFDQLSIYLTALTNIKDNERSWLINNANKAENAGERKGYSSDAVARIFGQMDGRLTTYVTEGLVTEEAYNAIIGVMSEIKTF